MPTSLIRPIRRPWSDLNRKARNSRRARALRRQGHEVGSKAQPRQQAGFLIQAVQEGFSHSQSTARRNSSGARKCRKSRHRLPIRPERSSPTERSKRLSQQPGPGNGSASHCRRKGSRCPSGGHWRCGSSGCRWRRNEHRNPEGHREKPASQEQEVGRR